MHDCKTPQFDLRLLEKSGADLFGVVRGYTGTVKGQLAKARQLWIAWGTPQACIFSQKETLDMREVTEAS